MAEMKRETPLTRTERAYAARWKSAASWYVTGRADAGDADAGDADDDFPAWAFELAADYATGQTTCLPSVPDMWRDYVAELRWWETYALETEGNGR